MASPESGDARKRGLVPLELAPAPELPMLVREVGVVLVAVNEALVRLGDGLQEANRLKQESNDLWRAKNRADTVKAIRDLIAYVITLTPLIVGVLGSIANGIAFWLGYLTRETATWILLLGIALIVIGAFVCMIVALRMSRRGGHSRPL